MNKYICIHGHFYQPPRENPWLEEIEVQDSAYPFRDWNVRINSECYEPNTVSRILDNEGKIIDIFNNYSRMSFNFGPTLLSWMETRVPKVYAAVLEADKESQKRFSGHGSALAQVYNHMIMPLSNMKDKETQVIWGIRDFEHRFKRKPEGMWLAETAVDLQTLEVLVNHGIKFTILSPYQAACVRPLGWGDDSWRDMVGAKIDPKVPYVCKLPSGKQISIFFYDGPLSQETAFGDLLKDGARFANKLMSLFPQGQHGDCLVNIADDGETYGHHHKFGNMALSFAFDHIERNHLAHITIYGEFLEKFPPQQEVRIIERSAWSCAHGVGRWENDCGCCIASKPGWNQKWRRTLRDTMNWLRDELSNVYEKEMTHYSNDPWALRNKYIDLVLDRSEESVRNFFKNSFDANINKKDQMKILKLLEMQRHAMLMFTSCGWFFDDISGIEPIQIMQYAARSMQLAKDINGVDLEAEYLIRIEPAKSNIPSMGDGKQIYLKYVKPLVIDLLNVGAHYAICSLFQDFSNEEQVYSFKVERSTYSRKEIGRQTFAVGKAKISSSTTLEEKIIDFAVLHLGDHNLTAGVRQHESDESFQMMSQQFTKIFRKKNIPDLIKVMDEYFKKNTYSLWDLFQHEQGKVINKIFESTVQSIEHNFRQIYDNYYPLMQLKEKIRIPLPKVLSMTTEFVLNRDLQNLLKNDELNIQAMTSLIEEINYWGFVRDKESLALKADACICRQMEKLFQKPENLKLLNEIESLIRLLNNLSLNLNLWRSQDLFFGVGQKIYREMHKKANEGDSGAKLWIESFDRLGKILKVKIRL